MTGLILSACHIFVPVLHLIALPICLLFSFSMIFVARHAMQFVLATVYLLVNTLCFPAVYEPEHVNNSPGA